MAGLCLLLLVGCSADLRLAKTFVARRTGIRAAVYFPEKAEVKSENDAANGASEVLEGFSKDLFLDIMYGAYREAMGAYDVEVYVPDDIENVRVDSAHWLVMLSRMEITGRITEYEDVLFSDMGEVSYKHPLNEVNVASWFEVSDGEWKPVLFCEHNLIDGFSSTTDYSFWTANIGYDYTIDTLQLDDVYHYAVYLGKLYAGYTYDYMMNDYVGDELKKLNREYQILFRYDPYKKQVQYAEEGDGFVELEE